MELGKLKKIIPDKIYKILQRQNIRELRPAQYKAIRQGLFKDKNLLVCTPTASGKTLVAEMIFQNIIINQKQKAIYLVPLKALATEKVKEFREKYGDLFKIGISIGDLDSSDVKLASYDLLIMTSEKLDALLRHNIPWLKNVGCVIIDEIHLLNDPSRGPTLEILITILRKLLQKVQLLGLSATIGNADELAAWLDAKLIEDSWRPVRLDKGVYLDGEISFQ